MQHRLIACSLFAPSSEIYSFGPDPDISLHSRNPPGETPMLLWTQVTCPLLREAPRQAHCSIGVPPVLLHSEAKPGRFAYHRDPPPHSPAQASRRVPSRSSLIESSAAGSSKVLRSPVSRASAAASMARRRIFPDLVFGSARTT